MAALVRVLGVRRVLAVELAFLAFTAVEFGTWVAILVYAYLTTGPASVGPVAVLQLVPAAILAPIAATLGDRMERSRALALSHGLIAIAMSAVGLAMAIAAPTFVTYLLAVAAAASLTTVRPLQAAILPALVGTAEQLTAANALSTVIEGAGVLVGPLVAGLILASASPGAVFLAAGVTAAGAAATVAAATRRTSRSGAAASTHHATASAQGATASADSGAPLATASSGPPATARGDSGAPLATASGDIGAQSAAASTHHATAGGDSAAPLWAGSADSGGEGPRIPAALDGIRAVASRRGARAMVALTGVRFAVIGAMDVVLVLAALELLGMGDGGAGYLAAAVGLGSVLGGGTALALVGRLTLAPFLLVGGLIWLGPVAGIALVPQALLAVGLLIVAGVGLALFDVAARTLLQRLTPAASLAAVFGVVEAFTMGGLALGALLAGPLVGLLGIAGALVVCGAALPLAALLALPVVVREEGGITIPLREIRLLRRLALFAPLSAGAIESAARALVPVAGAAGTMIIREGETGDRFYVIESGRVLVTRDRAPLRELGAGESFGEIALLRRVPRTASVVALTDVELGTLGRDDFLLAITGTPKSLDEADRLVERYLSADAPTDVAESPGASRSDPPDT